MTSKATVRFGSNCPEFLQDLIASALADAAISKPLKPGEPNPVHYPDFFDYWDACKEFERAGGSCQ